MPHRFILASVALLSACSGLAAEPDLLIHYAFEEGSGETTQDTSGNGFHGTVNAQWVDSPSGKALFFDGTPTRILNVQLPGDKRFGKESWTFMAWLKPKQFTIDDRQNQRRVFAFGTYPAAYLVIDLHSTGLFSCYFCYKNADGKTISTGASSAIRLALDQWAHIALVVDRQAGWISCYVNGYCSGPSSIRQGFDGNYVLGGALTLGSSWHNYWGVMDEVRIYRRALGLEDITKEFHAHKDTFGVKESEEAIAARRRDAMMKAFETAGEAWARRDFASVRAHCADALAAPESPAHFRSYAHLRIAQSFLAESNAAAARAEYQKISTTVDYPEVHRYEAAECVKELDRIAKGLPARDPSATRTRVPRVSTFAAEVYVAPDGSDTSDGSKAKPFATLQKARDAVRGIKSKGVNGPIGVRIMPGEYTVTEALELTAEDSGTEQTPIVYRAEEKGKAVFYGGKHLTGFTPVADPAVLKRLPEEARGKVMQCYLKAQGITDYGELKVRGFGQPSPPPTLELYFNGKPMTLARWPNEGFVGIKKLIEGGSKKEGKPSVFEYVSNRHARWTQANDAWLFGYFHFLWADATIRIGSIDTEACTITSAEPYHYGGRSMSTRQGIAYYAFNLLEEIDAPGEWYLDREAGILYFYPPSDPDKATVEIGMLSVPMIRAENISDVRFEGLTFDLARYNCMLIKDSKRCLVAGCTVSRMAGNGITIRGGEQNGLLGCDIHTIGRRATEVIGGDRETLTPGHHFVENCQIYSMGRIDRTYTPAIQLEGVGHRVAHNLMYNAPSSVMRIEGNDHLMEYNEVHSAVRESDDQGGMELFRNATYRGVVLRYNYYHNVGKSGKEAAVHGQAAIRFDDAISGMLVYGNLFVRGANGKFGAIQMNSGRDNVMDNNIFVDCKQGISGGWRSGNSVWKMLRTGKPVDKFYTNELYLSRYPDIKTMLEEPGINHIWRNVFYRCGAVATGNRRFLDLFQNGVFEEDPGFVNAAEGDYRLKPDAALFATVGLRPLPIAEIGLYEDEYRATWPVETTPGEMPDWRATSEH